MALMWSRIHAELGLSPQPLTYAMVEQAIAQGVRENEDLDWKRDLAWKKDLPPDAKEKKKREFAKDVAAMANTRGGLIVFGVSEENERPVKLLGVPNSEQDRQAMRSFTHKYLRPLVDSLVIEPLNGEDDAPGLIVVSVPPSPDAPHVIGEKNEMGIPHRDGSDTLWMSEGQLERAYRDRFSRRADDRAALTALIDGLVPEIDFDKGVWLAVAARPIAPLPLLSRRPQREQVSTTLRTALQLASEVFGRGQGRVPVLNELLSGDAVNNARHGLRRWVIRSNHYSTDAQERVNWALVELHHDGSIALAISLGAFTQGVEIVGTSPTAMQVHLKIVDAAIAEAVTLAATHARGLGTVGTILARAALLTSKAAVSAPLEAIDNQLIGGMSSLYQRVPGSRAVRNPVAVEAGFSAEDDVAALRGVARQLADDLNHQFGTSGSTIPD
ncbi:putative DNA-binding protein [Lentzea atacamensis]|uniref:DNA-binding protein n=1 Tax=Lentzea atacamensis TaxID=531938 RepID=A0ABX9DX96_9PSEU|nr:ATP-binding protein [Lentzea atacamensis]RAS59217.1 putative DNA-binding protein [Lentzea atacamensis]